MSAPLFGQVFPNGGFWYGGEGPFIYSIPSDLKCLPSQALGTALGPEAASYGLVTLEFIADFFSNIKSFINTTINCTTTLHRPRQITLPNYCFPFQNEFVNYRDTNVTNYANGTPLLFEGSNTPCLLTTFQNYDWMKFAPRWPTAPQTSAEAIFQVQSFSIPVECTSMADPNIPIPPGCAEPAWPIYFDEGSLDVTIKFSTGFIGYFDPNYWGPNTVYGNNAGHTIRCGILIGPAPYYRSPPPGNNPFTNPLNGPQFGNWFNAQHPSGFGDTYFSGYFTFNTRKGALQIPMYGITSTGGVSSFSGSMEAVYS